MTVFPARSIVSESDLKRRAASATARPHRWGLMLLPLIYVPLFVCLPNLSIPILHLLGFETTRDSINLHFSIFACIGGGLSLLTARINRRLLAYLLFFLVWLTLSLLAGYSRGFSFTNALFYAQTILPLFVLVFGHQLIRTDTDLKRFLRISVFTGAVTALLLTIAVVTRYGPQSLLFERIQVMRDLAYGIPQFKSYYPLCVLATFSFSLAQYLFEDCRRGKVALVYLAMQCLFLPLCWSRSGLLGFVLCAAIQFFMLATGMAKGNKHRMGVAIAAFAIVLPVAFTYLGSTVSSRTDVHDLDNKSDQKRLELAQEGMHRALDRPVFGDMFIPSMDERVGGEEIDVPRMFGAHNQWVDMLLRGGFLFVIVFAAMYWQTLKKCLLLAKGEHRKKGTHYTVFAVSTLSFLIASAIAANFQLYFVQLQTATPIFMLIGMTFKVHDLAHRRKPSLAPGLPRRTGIGRVRPTRRSC